MAIPAIVFILAIADAFSLHRSRLESTIGNENATLVDNSTNRTVEDENATGVSVCLVARMIVIELPYVASWIKYHKSIGVSAFYFTTDRSNELPTIREFLSKLKKETPGLHSTHITVVYSTLRRSDGYPLVVWLPKNRAHGYEETFTLSVDPDEYWLLPRQYKTLQQMIRANPRVNQFRANWWCVEDDSLKGDKLKSPFHGLYGWSYKSLVRTSVITKRATWDRPASTMRDHRPEINHNVPKTYKELGYVVHFWARSFLDPILKSGWQFKSVKGGGEKSELIGMARDGTDIPTRLKVVAYLKALPKQEILNVGRPMLDVDTDLELKLLGKVLSWSDVIKLHKVYSKYKACVSKHPALRYTWGPKQRGEYKDPAPYAGSYADWTKDCSLRLRKGWM